MDVTPRSTRTDGRRYWSGPAAALRAGKNLALGMAESVVAAPGFLLFRFS